MFSFKTEAQKKIIIASTEYYRHDIFACTWYFIAFVVFLFFVVVFFCVLDVNEVYYPAIQNQYR